MYSLDEDNNFLIDQILLEKTEHVLELVFDMELRIIYRNDMSELKLAIPNFKEFYSVETICDLTEREVHTYFRFGNHKKNCLFALIDDSIIQNIDLSQNINHEWVLGTKYNLDPLMMDEDEYILDFLVNTSKKEFIILSSLGKICIVNFKGRVLGQKSLDIIGESFLFLRESRKGRYFALFTSKTEIKIQRGENSNLENLLSEEKEPTEPLDNQSKFKQFSTAQNDFGLIKFRAKNPVYQNNENSLNKVVNLKEKDSSLKNDSQKFKNSNRGKYELNIDTYSNFSKNEKNSKASDSKESSDESFSELTENKSEKHSHKSKKSKIKNIFNKNNSIKSHNSYDKEKDSKPQILNSETDVLKIERFESRLSKAISKEPDMERATDFKKLEVIEYTNSDDRESKLLNKATNNPKRVESAKQAKHNHIQIKNSPEKIKNCKKSAVFCPISTGGQNQVPEEAILVEDKKKEEPVEVDRLRKIENNEIINLNKQKVNSYNEFNSDKPGDKLSEPSQPLSQRVNNKKDTRKFSRDFQKMDSKDKLINEKKSSRIIEKKLIRRKKQSFTNYQPKSPTKLISRKKLNREGNSFVKSQLRDIKNDEYRGSLKNFCSKKTKKEKLKEENQSIYKTINKVYLFSRKGEEWDFICSEKASVTPENEDQIMFANFSQYLDKEKRYPIITFVTKESATFGSLFITKDLKLKTSLIPQALISPGCEDSCVKVVKFKGYKFLVVTRAGNFMVISKRVASVT